MLTLVLVIVVNLALGLLPPPPGGQLRPHRRPHLRLPPRLRLLHPAAVRLAETSISSSGRSAAAWRATNDGGGGCSVAGLGETQAQDVPVRAVAGRRRAARRRVHGGHRAAVPSVQRNEHCPWCHYLSCVPTKRWRCDASPTTCTGMQQENTLTVVCAGGKNQTYVVASSADATQGRINDLCNQLCT